MFSLIANLSWYGFQENQYDIPDIFTDMIEVYADVKKSRIINPFVILLASFGVLMRNFPQFLFHILFWWVIIPRKMMGKK